MELKNLVEQIKKTGYERPEVMVKTPEIRTIDELVMRKSKIEKAEIIVE